jgi:hypothetical protein
LKKKLLRLLGLLFGLYLAWTAFSSLTFRPRTNGLPLPPLYKKGVFHLHSVFSDGRGTVDEICRAAGVQGLDFVILTDHGRPNRAATAATSRLHGTLLIGASEFSLLAGHMAAAGYGDPDYIFPPEPQEAIDEVGRRQGVTFISHPLDGRIPWRDWSLRGFSGIEVMSLYQLAKKNLLQALFFFPLRYLLNSDYALTSLISYPQGEMDIWDRCNRSGRYYGIYALDSHAKLPLGQKHSLHFPSYGATFRILTVYVKLESALPAQVPAAAAAVVAALRRGSFFNAIEALAPANGFEHFYLEPDGRRVEMGGAARAAGGTLVFKLPFAFATDVVVRKDGAVFRTIRAERLPELSVPVGAAGVYRAEVRLASGRFKKLPWIMANPVFVAVSAPAAPAAETAAGPALAVGQQCFQVEKNAASEGSISSESGSEGAVTRLAFTLRQENADNPDFWAALACRQAVSGAGYRGFVFETRAVRPLRVWLQFRSKSGRYRAHFQHSFLAGPEWRRVAIPLSAFFQVLGKTSVSRTELIESFFFLVDNGVAYPGASGEIFLRNIGLY